MSFTQEYQKKLTTADEAVKVVKSGDRLEYGWCVTTPVALDEALAKRMPDLENIQIHGGIVMRPLAITQIENPADHFTWNSWHMGGLERKWINEGFSFYAPIRYSELPSYYRDCLPGTDVVMMQVAPMDAHGYFNFGPSASHTAAMLEKAKCVIVEVNENMPRCLGGFEEGIHISKVDMIVEGNNPAIDELGGGGAATEVDQAVARLRKSKYSFELLFLEASDQVLLKRYKETRRIHPLSTDGDLMKGITQERALLASIREQADYVIDTTNLLTRELKAELDRIFVNNEKYNSLMVNVISFGFKHGIPQDADLVFDVRFLPNPFYIDEMKPKTGLDKEVHDYVMSFQEAHQFLDKLTDMITFLIPNYVKEGKNQLVVAIGCTGGQHRSVTLAIELYNRLSNQGEYGLTLRHRDIK